MRFSIKYKLLLTFFVATVAVVGAMWLLIDWSFDRGFLQYVNTAEEESQNRFISLLAEDYESSGGWNSLVQDRQRWMEYGMTAYVRSRNQTRQAEQNGDEAPSNRIETGDAESSSNYSEQRSSRRQRSRKYSSLILLDKDKQRLIGRVRDIDEMELKPINIDGELVGYLGSRPRGLSGMRLNDYNELRFSESQGRAFTLIALATIFIATILLLPLSRNLVKPINKLAGATRVLASGNYDVRIPVNSNDEIGQLSRNLNSLAKTLGQNESARRQWIADISHELRTPLSVMRGEIESMQDGIRDVNPERLNALHKEVMNLNRLIGDLYELSLSDIGALSYNKQVVDLDEVINISLATLQDEFTEKNIQVSVQTDEKNQYRIFADADRLQQLFANLLTNSLRYTDEGGELRIMIKQDRGNVVISFQDSAPSVNDDDLLRLFERLYRVESSRNRATGGAGLGLSICKNIVEAHEGTITAQRSPINGLWINIEFPHEA